MRRVVFNQKGGVGKSTIACNLAAISAIDDKKTLVIDLDVQCNTTHYLLGGKITDPDRTIAHFFKESLGVNLFGKSNSQVLASVIHETRWPNLYVIPAHSELEPLQSRLESRYKIYKLREALDQLEGFDHVYLDTPAALNFYTGVNNDDANFKARVFLRLAEGSMPRMPPGITVDTGATFSDLARYDVRVAVAVQDPHDPTDSNSPVDVYWTKTTYTNTNITTDTTEYYQNPAAQTAGVFSAAKSADFVGTLNGYTYRGFIPNELTASVPDAPGVIVSFGGTDVVYTDSFYKFFEILIKLPACTVTPITTAGYIDVSGNEVMPISPDVENVECANRGQCNRATGECQCFQGYFGIACHRQTVLA